MCGRFTFTNVNPKHVAERFKLKSVPANLKSNSNIAPQSEVAVILNESPEKLSFARWGLIPHWAKDENIGVKMFNARAETIIEKPSFRESFRAKRCLILADGFFEWKKAEGGGRKTPYKITLKDESIFAFAGIWDVWKHGGGEITSCAIITTVPNEVISPIHDRMPVILPIAKQDLWLQDIGMSEAVRLLKSFPGSQMQAQEAR